MNKAETWLQANWRPMMALVIMIVILFDFILAPVLWGAASIFLHVALVQWMPATLGSGGIFYVAMGSYLGITSFTRGQEKLEKIKADAAVLESTK